MSFLGLEDGGGVLEIRVSKLRCSSYRLLAVRATGKKNHENSSNSGEVVWMFSSRSIFSCKDLTFLPFGLFFFFFVIKGEKKSIQF